MSKTSIEWVRNPDGSQGYTLNSKTGCLNHTPEGLCLGGGFPCYAYKLANGRLKERYLANENILFSNYIIRRTPWANMTARQTMADPFHPRFWPERLEEPYKVKKPMGIFLDDMSDWMGDYWPEEWTRQELQMMKDNPQHRIYTLTKQAQKLSQWSPFPPNCWVGVTVTRSTLNPDTDMFDKAMNGLSAIEAKIKYISFEPLLDWEFEAGCHDLADFLSDVVNGVIIGACTGTLTDLKPLALKYPELTLMPYGVGDPELPFTRGKKWTLQPKIEWVEKIARACDKAGVKVFLKDNLSPLIWRIGLSLRQGLPEVAGTIDDRSKN